MGQEATSVVGDLEHRAEGWIAGYSQAHHLIRTRYWVVQLDPAADDALRLAALTHDIERHVPGGPTQDRAASAWDDPEYLAAHSERSARIVGAWIREQGGAETLARDVEALIRAHELGGSPEADLLQAADSISFLETLAPVSAAWVRDGVCSADKAKEKHAWMYQRIRLQRARELARPYYEAALAAVDGVAPASRDADGQRMEGGARKP
jgi:hypothetical protein